MINFSQATAASPCWPFGALAGAATVLFLTHGAKPSCMFDVVSMLKVGVEGLAKKWWPEIRTSDAGGASVACVAEVRLYCRARLGREESMVGETLDRHVALKRVAIAPIATGADAEVESAQV